jgi:hypothetical protein
MHGFTVLPITSVADPDGDLVSFVDPWIRDG